MLLVGPAKARDSGIEARNFESLGHPAFRVSIYFNLLDIEAPEPPTLKMALNGKYAALPDLVRIIL